MTATVLMTVTNGFTNDPRVRKEAASLSRAGFRVVVCSFDRTLSFKQSEHYEGVIVKRMRASLPYGKVQRALLLMPIFLFFCLLHSLILRPRVIHCHDFDTMGAGIITKILLHRTKLVYDAHEHYPSMIQSIVPPPLYHLIRILDHAFTTIADCVIVPSLYRTKLYPTAREIIEVPNVPSKADARRFRTNSDRFTIYYGGALVKETGIVKLIALASKLNGVRLVLAGNGPLRAFVTKEAASMPNVDFLGPIDRSVSLELLGSSHVAVAMYEPCNVNNVYAASNKIFEAMLLGVPVVTNRETIMSEIVDKEACGLVVPYYDDTALERAIMMFKMDEDFRRKLGNNGRIASERYCWESSEPRFLTKYGELTSDSSGD